MKIGSQRGFRGVDKIVDAAFQGFNTLQQNATRSRHLLETKHAENGGLCVIGRNPPWAQGVGRQFESISGGPETLRNLERISCKTVFLGSQDFVLRTDANVLLTASIRQLGRYPQHFAGS
jgi:hypothetical protein